jgi:viologen exporter family transport system ATP-binding protein
VDLVDDATGLQVSDPDAQLMRQEGQRFCLAFDPQRISAHDLIARIARNYPVHDLFVENPPIEAIIAQMYSQRAAAVDQRIAALADGKP